MIKPSQRRQKRAPANTDLNLHTQMAKTRSWHWRLLGASAVATGVSVVLWLVGVPLLWHLLLVSVSFLGGLAYPVRGSLPWAMSWIADKAGLSYQTALELDLNPNKDIDPNPNKDIDPNPDEDGYGFSQAIQERALATTNRLEPPQNPRWWLPLTALAFGLALLPFTPFRDVNRFTNVELPPALQGAGVEADASPEAEEPAAAPEEQEELAETPDAPDTPRADEDAPSVLDEFDDTNADAPPEGVGGQSEEEALSRFTENLSEREPPEQTNPFNSVPPENEPATSDEPREGDPNTQSPADGESQEQAQEGQQQGEQQAGEQEGEQTEGAQDQTQGGEEETPSAEAQAEGEQQGEQESQGAEDASATEATEQGAESQDQNALDEGGNDAAGQNPSAAAAEEATDLSQQDQAEPEFVEGRLGEGPSTVGGTVRLPGSSEDDAVVTGSPGSFNQAEEQAITEGRIPVEYQDIVRNYFR